MRAFCREAVWPRVSVVIRCKDERPWLERALRLVAEQDYEGEVEIVLVDSGSRDGTRELPLPPGARWLDMKPEDFSYGASLNLGCRQAKGDILVLLSAHCFPLSKAWLRALVAPFSQEGVGLVHGRQVGDLRLDPSEAAELETLYPQQDRRGGTSFSDANAAIPRALFEACPFDEQLPIGEEAPLVQYALSKGFEIHYSAAAAVEHGHPADPPSLWRRSFREGWVLENHHYRGRRSYSLAHFAYRLLGRTLRGAPRTLVLQGFSGLLRKLRLDALRLRARHQGARAAQGGHPCSAEPPSGLRPLSPPPPRSYAIPDGPPFCLAPTPEGEARVRADLERIAARLRAELPQLRALWLAGGFGRGEGLLEAGHPPNDYDLELLVARPVAPDLLASLSRELARDCQVTWVDLEAHNLRQLRQLCAHSQYGYDLAHGARLLWSACGRPPALLPAPRLPFVEAEKILCARIWAMLYAWPPAQPDPRRAHWQLVKACLALADARLIEAGLYRSHLREKQKMLDTLPQTPGESKAYTWAFAQRLGDPHQPCPLGWSQLRDLYLETWAALASRQRGLPIDSPEALARTFPGIGRRDPIGRLVRALSPRRDRERSEGLRAGILLLARLDPEAADPGSQEEAHKLRNAYLSEKLRTLEESFPLLAP